MISFCQFGTGRIAAIHAANIARHPEARLEVIVDVDLSRAAGWASRHGAAVVAECGVPLMLRLNRLFDPHFGWLERQLRQGRIGRIELLGITSRDPAARTGSRPSLSPTPLESLQTRRAVTL